MFHIYFTKQDDTFYFIWPCHLPFSMEEWARVAGLYPVSARDKNHPSKLYKWINMCLTMVSGNWLSQLLPSFFLTGHFSLCPRPALAGSQISDQLFWAELSSGVIEVALPLPFKSTHSPVWRGELISGFKVNLRKSVFISLALHEG